MPKEFNFEHYAKNLPDAYRKDKESNNYKILEVEKQSTQMFNDDAENVFESLDIWQATGKTLDLYGEIYNLPRKDMNDDQYRIMILLKLAQNRSGSDHASIVSTLASVLGVPVDTFWMTDSDVPGNVDINALPYNVIQEAGVSIVEVWTRLKALLAAGVGIERFNVVHGLPDIETKIATVVTHGVEYVVDIKEV